MLDGAILVLCAVGGVQAQSLTIDRQMRRYRVPRLAFINKMDRTGRQPAQGGRATAREAGLRRRADADSDRQRGRVRGRGRPGPPRKRSTSTATTARRSAAEPIPAELADEARRRPAAPARSAVDVQRRADGAAAGRGAGAGGADRRRGAAGRVEPAVHAGVPGHRPIATRACSRSWTRWSATCLRRWIARSKALAHDDPHKELPLAADPAQPTVAMAFKIVEDPYGTLTFMRIYQGQFVKGGNVLQPAERPQGAVQPHRADARRPAGGHRLGLGRRHRGRAGRRRRQRRHLLPPQYPYCTLQSMFVPEPVIKMAIAPANRDGADRLSKALHRFRREDPTLHVTTDEETGETHHRRHGRVAPGDLRRADPPRVQRRGRGGRPKVNYREAPTQPAEFNTRHRKQTGGSGQYAHIVGRMEPLPEDAEEHVRLRGRGGRRADSQAVHPGHRKGLPADGPQGARWPATRWSA